MSLSIVKAAYRSLIPQSVRQSIWNLRTSKTEHPSKNAEPQVNAGDLVCDVCKKREIGGFRNETIAQLSYKFFRCNACKYIFVYPKPNPLDTYPETAVEELGAHATTWNNYYLSAIEKYAQPSGSLLEIGFGDGSFLKLAHDRGFNVSGIELSKACVQNAKEKLGLPNIFLGTLDDVALQDEQFDVIAAYNFFEHVSDINATLAAMKRVLKKNGLLALLCPNIDGLIHRVIHPVFSKDLLNISWVPPYHLSYFNKANLKLMLESNGLTVLGDESKGAHLLWLQHADVFGPKSTDKTFEESSQKVTRFAGKGAGRTFA